MKFIISAAFVACLAMATHAKVSDEFLAKMPEYKEECIKESGIDAKLVEEFEKMHKGEMKPPTPEQIKQFDTKEVKCFGKCMAIKLGMINEKGEIQYDTITKTFDIPADSDVMKQVRQCADAKGQDADMCERISGIKQCVMKAMKDKRP